MTCAGGEGADNSDALLSFVFLAVKTLKMSCENSWPLSCAGTTASTTWMMWDSTTSSIRLVLWVSQCCGGSREKTA